jgi:hypothetical protein
MQFLVKTFSGMRLEEDIVCNCGIEKAQSGQDEGGG